ncbi:hypothetical protein HYH03_009630 [Edaphochlamys debaryana]|uniref:FAD dependent oxidoreductase domain-containing protein n=1 Tax=Edaphochlamys debaryana TaxID=47281 RepID=A0A835Y6Y9_9CHLO|nr:hypothetical protein HYH03_009630 [Edaphochlamys debaryana]|eukprot:KAG2492139.1 hypothetical protein HYH03_009630 [Edaphochlamys debaryana]
MGETSFSAPPSSPFAGPKGFKIGKYHHLHEQLRGGQEQLDAMRRTPDAADEAALRRGAAAFFPAAGSGRLLSASACLFTNTPDGHFLVDRHPRHPQVVLCSACSGHGFKMSSGIGELLAHMVAAGPSAADQDPGSRSASGTGLESDSAADAKSLEAGDMGAGMRLMRPFRLDPGRRGGAAALARFGASG